MIIEPHSLLLIMAVRDTAIVTKRIPALRAGMMRVVNDL
jgi:hypothetical protein